MVDADRPLPYCGPAPLPDTWAAAWNLDPVVLTAVALAWGAGVRWGDGRAASVAAGGALLAFVSPLCALTVALFAARTLHHLVLIALVAPALALAFPWRRAPMGPALLALSATLWAWHVPAVYAAAWDSHAIYWAMQGTLLSSGWAFWAAVLNRRAELAGALGAATGVGALALQMGLIGAILVFAPAVLYPEHLAGAEGFGLGALRDQHLAGLVMWVPGMAPLALVAAWVLRRSWRAVATA